MAHVRNLKLNAVVFYLSSLAPLAGELHDDVMERTYNKIKPRRLIRASGGEARNRPTTVFPR